MPFIFKSLDKNTNSWTYFKYFGTLENFNNNTDPAGQILPPNREIVGSYGNVKSLNEAWDLIPLESKSRLKNKNISTASFNQSVPFSNTFIQVAPYRITDDIEFTVNSERALPGAVTLYRIVSDGEHMVTFNGIKEIGTSQGYNNTEDILNIFVFFFDGLNYYVNIFQEKNPQAVDISAPTLVSIEIPDANRNRIVLTYSENLNETSVPSHNNFRVTNRTQPTVTVDADKVILQYSYNFEYGDVVYIAYTVGDKPIMDVDGNEAVGFSSTLVTNNIEPPDIVASTMVGATVEDVNPDKIILEFDETINPDFEPDYGDFVPSGDRSVTNIEFDGVYVILTVDEAYTHDMTIRIAYNQGETSLQDMDGNAINSIPLTLVTNNIEAPSSPAITLAWEAMSNATYVEPELIASGIGGARATTTIAATAAFYVRTIVPSPSSQTNATVVYLDSVNTANYSWTPGLVFRCGFYHYGGTLYASDGGYGAIDTGFTVNAGDWLQMVKSGNNVILQRSTNSGSSWTDVYTYSDALLGQTTLYTKVIFAAAESQRITVTQG